MNRYIEADKLLDIIIKMRKEYATQEVAEDHKGLRAVLGGQCLVLTKIIEIINSLQQEQPDKQPEYGPYARQYPKSEVSHEQPEIDSEKFAEKIKTFQERYKHPENISVKGAMAFMARMFYQYPNVARLWYDSLPKATMDNERKEE